MPVFAAAADLEDMLGAMMAVVIAIVIVALIILICYLLTLSKALSRCRPENRLMEPGMVWLNLIPLFNIVWQFITVNRVSGSLKNEYYDRGMDHGGGDYGASLGVTYCAMNIAGLIPFIGPLFGLVGLICFIMYWVKIAGFSGELARAGYDDYDDRRGRGRGRGRDDYDDRDDDRYDDDRDDDRGRRRGGRDWS